MNTTPYTIINIKDIKEQRDKDLQYQVIPANKSFIRKYWPHIITAIVISGLIVGLFLLIRQTYK